MVAIHDSTATVRLLQALDNSAVGTGPFSGARVLLDGINGTAPAYVLFALNIDGSAVSPIVIDKKSATTTQSNITSSTTSQLILQGNGSRLGAIIFNESTQNLYLLVNELNSPASTSVFSTIITSNSSYEVPSNYIMNIFGIWATANGTARVTEFT